MLTQDFIPGLGDQHEVGAGGLGTTIINVTVGMSTYTAAQLIAAKSNAESGQDSPVVILHSLKVAPSFVIAQSRSSSLKATIDVVTANASAVYLRAYPSGVTSGVWAAEHGLGVAARIVVVR
jgi:hypothetical protein